MTKPATMLLADGDVTRLPADLARAEAALQHAQLAKERAQAALAAQLPLMRLPARWREVLAVIVPLSLWAGAGAWFAWVWL